MHEIEPHFNWRHLYRAEDDPHSPFYRRTYSEIYFTNTVYNYYIHPQWDEFGSQTLYAKILFCDYDKHFCVIELMGEWNDLLYNDIMFLYRNLSHIYLLQLNQPYRFRPLNMCGMEIALHWFLHRQNPTRNRSQPHW